MLGAASLVKAGKCETGNGTRETSRGWGFRRGNSSRWLGGVAGSRRPRVMPGGGGGGGGCDGSRYRR